MKLSYNLEEAAEATGFSQDTLKRRIHNGELRAKRSNKNGDGNGVGRHIILATDLQAWLDGLASA